MVGKNIDYDELKGQLDKAWKKALVALNKGKEEIIRISRIGKIKLDAQMLHREKKEIFQKMGEETYKGLKSSSLDLNSFQKHIEKIEKINDKIKDCHEKIEELSKSQVKKQS